MKLVIQFLESIPEERWCCDIQELEFSKFEQEASRCVLGHLGLDSKSPLFYDNNINIGNGWKSVSRGPVIHLNTAIQKRLGMHLTYYNNGIDKTGASLLNTDKHNPFGIKKRAIQAIIDYTEARKK